MFLLRQRPLAAVVIIRAAKEEVGSMERVSLGGCSWMSGLNRHMTCILSFVSGMKPEVNDGSFN